MLSYKWSVEKVVTTGESNLITQIYWRCDASDDVNFLSAGVSGVRNLTASNTFIPYSELSEDQILAWCCEPMVITCLNESNISQSTVYLIKNEIESQTARQIYEQLAKKST